MWQRIVNRDGLCCVPRLSVSWDVGGVKSLSLFRCFKVSAVKREWIGRSNPSQGQRGRKKRPRRVVVSGTPVLFLMSRIHMTLNSGGPRFDPTLRHLSATCWAVFSPTAVYSSKPSQYLPILLICARSSPLIPGYIGYGKHSAISVCVVPLCPIYKKPGKASIHRPNNSSLTLPPPLLPIWPCVSESYTLFVPSLSVTVSSLSLYPSFSTLRPAEVSAEAQIWLSAWSPPSFFLSMQPSQGTFCVIFSSANRFRASH